MTSGIILELANEHGPKGVHDDIAVTVCKTCQNPAGGGYLYTQCPTYQLLKRLVEVLPQEAEV